jgi:osmoprotectant transport system ATP-binding protein
VARLDAIRASMRPIMRSSLRPTKDPPAAIALDGVTKSLAGKRVLAETTLTLAPGQRLALLGPSGSGKSTLLRLVVGLIAPDTGEVALFGERLTKATAPAIRRRLGYVIQDGGLFPHLTAADNVTLMARHVGLSRERIEGRLGELTGLVRLDGGMLARYPAELSGGQRQRVGLMRALMLEPDLLLFDEPMGALDPIVRGQLQDDLRRIFDALGKTVLLVTHDVGEAAALADEVALLHEGRIVQRGPLRQLVEHPADPFVSAFLASARAPAWNQWAAAS